MLAAANRLGDASSFREVTRRGRRAASPTLVLHVLAGPRTGDVGGSGPRIGLVVSRAVGNAVARNRVKRRLRHLLGARLDDLAGATVVVRALPAAAQASSRGLAADLDRCLRRTTPGPGAPGTSTGARS